MAYQVNSLDYGDYRYSVGDTIVISSSKEYMYGDIGSNSIVSAPGISQDVRKISGLWVQDATGAVVNNPIYTTYHTGPMRYGSGFLRFDQIASGGLKIRHYVTYNANGGSGAPGTQTKVYGSILTLSTAKPTRTGYTFAGWNTRSDGSGTGYSSGQQYGDDNDLTLYARWVVVTYTVTYNANGGSGAPGNQYKAYGSSLKLSTATPSRTGYTFKGWATSSGGGVSYAPGANYTTNASITLYAVWQAMTYAVSYNANGGSGAPAAQTKTYGVTLTLSSTRPTRTNYNFLGWGVSSGSTSVSYSPGGQYTSNASITLYAVWQLAYTKPRITNVSIARCISSGSLNDEGTYAKVSFNWATDKSVTSIKIEHKVSTGSAWTSTNVTASGTSGNVSTVIGAGAFNIENVYDVRITVTDSLGSNNPTYSLPGTKFIIDMLPNGNGGIAFGGPANKSGYAVFNYAFEAKGAAYFKNAITPTGGVYMSGYPGRVNFPLSSGYIELVTESNGASLNLPYMAPGVTSWIRNYMGIRPNDKIMHIGTTDDALVLKGRYISADTQIRSAVGGGSWVSGRNRATIRNTTATGSSFGVLASQKVTNGSWDIGCINNELYFSYASDTNFNANTNVTTRIQFKNNGSITTDGLISGHNAKFYQEVTAGSIELIATRPYIDFHGAESSADFTQRIISNGTTGNLIADPGISNQSDRRLKEDINELPESYLNVLRELRPVTFRYKRCPDSLRVGFIAQDMVEALHNNSIEDMPIVEQADDEDGTYSLDYNQMAALAIYGWQQQQKEIDELKQQVKELKELVFSLSRKKE